MKKTLPILLALLLVAAIAMFAACSENIITPIKDCTDGHTWSEKIITQDCEQGGTLQKTCTVCGKVETSDWGPAEHVWGSPDITQNPTCTVAGKQTVTCTVCGKSGEQEIPAAHTKGDKVDAVAATCTQSGMQQYWKCVNCDAKLDADGNAVTDEQLVVAALGHKYRLDATQGDNGWTWTGTEGAVAHFKCANDNCPDPIKDVTAQITSQKVDNTTTYTATAAVPETTDGTVTDTKTVTDTPQPQQHVHVYGQPTWVWEDDFSKATATFTCTGDGDCDRLTVTVVAEGESISSQITQEANCTTPGQQTYTAHVQGPDDKPYMDAKIEDLGNDPDKHDFSKPVEQQEPTCTEPGHTAGLQCSRCDATQDVDEIPAKGHSYTLASTPWTWSQDNAQATLHLVCSNDADHTQEIDVDSTSQSASADCTTPGDVTYTVTITKEELSQQLNLKSNDKLDVEETNLTATKKVSGVALGHNFEAKFVWPQSYDNKTLPKVTVTLDCSRCEEEITEGLTVTVTEKGTHEAPTCTQGSSATFTASVEYEGKTYTDEHTYQIEKLQHEFTVDVPKKDPTCTEPGHTAGKQCAHCTEQQDVTRIEPTGHSWVVDTNNGGWIWGEYNDGNPTVTVAIKCEKCTETKTIDATATLVGQVEQSTCIQAGKATYSASAQYEKATFNTTENHEYTLPLADHQWSETYKSAGESGHYRTCTVCSTHDVTVGHTLSAKPEQSTDKKHIYKCTADGCGYTQGEDCTAKKEYEHDNDFHWHLCQYCNAVISSTRQEHNFIGDDNHCEQCNVVKSQVEISWEDGAQTHNVDDLQAAIQYITSEKYGALSGVTDITITLANGTTAAAFSVPDGINLTLVLGGDYTVSGGTIMVPTGASLAISSEGGKKVRPDSNYAAKVALTFTQTLISNEGTLTLDNVTVVGWGEGTVAVHNKGTLRLANGGAISASGTALAVESGSVEATNGAITGKVVVACNGEVKLPSGFVAANLQLDGIACDNANVAIGGTKQSHIYTAVWTWQPNETPLDSADTIPTASATVTCSICGDKHESVNATVTKNDGGTDPTCENTGTATFTAKVADYNVEDTSDEYKIKALGHTWKVADTPWTWAEDFSKAYFHLVCTTDGQHTKQIEVTPETDEGTPTCTAVGKVTHTATISIAEITEQTSGDNIDQLSEQSYTNTVDGVDIPALGHEWKITNVDLGEVDFANKTASLTVTLTCQRGENGCDSSTHTVTLEGVKSTSEIEATCTQAQVLTFSCNVAAEVENLLTDEHKGSVADGDELQDLTATGKALGHNYTIGKDAWSWQKADGDNYNVTLKLTCSRCKDGDGHTKVLTQKGVTPNETTPATCDKAGSKFYTVTFTAPEDDSANTYPESMTGNHTDTIEALGHEWEITDVALQEGSVNFEQKTATLTVTLTCQRSENGCEGSTHTVTIEGVKFTSENEATCTDKQQLTFSGKVTAVDKTVKLDELTATEALGKNDTVSGSKEFELPATGEALGHDFKEYEDSVYKESGRGHVVQCHCTGCDEYDTTVIDHVYGDFKHIDGTETHSATCSKCHVTETLPCKPVVSTSGNGEQEVCSDCEEHYEISVTVHFRLYNYTDKDNSSNSKTWTPAGLRIYVYSKENSEILGEYPGKLNTVTSTGTWYSTTFTVRKGCIANDLFVILNDNYNGDRVKTGDILVTAPEIWINAYSNAAVCYTSKQAAEDATKSYSSGWKVAGTFNNWSAMAGFKLSSNKLVLNLKAGTEFKVVNGSSWYGYGNGNIQIKDTNGGSLTWDKIAYVDSYDNNIKLHYDCRLVFTVSGSSAVITVIGSKEKENDPNPFIEEHDLGTKHEAKDPTCVGSGNVEYWICKNCGAKLDANGKVLYDTNLPATGVHKGQEVKAQEATCQADGWNTFYKCSECGKYAKTKNGEYKYTEQEIKQQEDVKRHKLGHSYKLAGDEWYTWKADESSATLTLTFVCEHSQETCERHTVSITISNSDVQYITSVRTDPTCTTAGKVVYSVDTSKLTVEAIQNLASKEKITGIDIESLPEIAPKEVALDIVESAHEYTNENVVWNWPESIDWTSDVKPVVTAQLVCSHNGEHKVEITADQITVGGEKTLPTCEAGGSVTYTATFSYGEQQYSTTKEYTTGALGHSFVLDTGEGHADGYTFGNDGTNGKLTIYLMCEHENGHKVTITVGMVGTETQPTCEVNGYYTFEGMSLDHEAIKEKLASALYSEGSKYTEKDTVDESVSVTLEQQKVDSGNLATGHSFVLDQGGDHTSGHTFENVGKDGTLTIYLMCQHENSHKVTITVSMDGTEATATCETAQTFTFDKEVSGDDVLSELNKEPKAIQDKLVDGFATITIDETIIGEARLGHSYAPDTTKGSDGTGLAWANDQHTQVTVYLVCNREDCKDSRHETTVTLTVEGVSHDGTSCGATSNVTYTCDLSIRKDDVKAELDKAQPDQKDTIVEDQFTTDNKIEYVADETIVGHTWQKQGEIAWQTGKAAATATITLQCTKCKADISVEFTLDNPQQTAATCTTDAIYTYTLNVSATEVLAKALAQHSDVVHSTDTLTEATISGTDTYTEPDSATGHTWTATIEWQSKAEELTLSDVIDITNGDKIITSVTLECGVCKTHIDNGSEGLTVQISGAPSTDPDCGSKGYVTFTASVLYNGAVIEKVDEQESPEYTIAATGEHDNLVIKDCSWSGNTETPQAKDITMTLRCQKCDAELIAEVTDVLLGDIQDPTCTTDGSQEYNVTGNYNGISYSGGVIEVKLPATGHNWVLDENAIDTESGIVWNLEELEPTATVYFKCSHEECIETVSVVSDVTLTQNKGANCQEYGTGTYTLNKSAEDFENAIKGENVYTEKDTFDFAALEDVTKVEDGKGIVGDHVWDEEYHDVGDGYHTHQCTVCNEYDEAKKQPHSTFEYNTTTATEHSHNKVCIDCHNSQPEKCTIESNAYVCKYCEEDYSDKVTVHYHKGLGWTTNSVYVNGSFDDYQNTTHNIAIAKMSGDTASTEGWFTLEMTFLKDVARKVQFFNTNSTSAANKTALLSFVASKTEVWISYDGKIFDDVEHADLHENTNTYILVGYLNGSVNWKDSPATDRKFTYLSTNVYTLTATFQAGDAFKVKQYGDAKWTWQINGSGIGSITKGSGVESTTSVAGLFYKYNSEYDNILAKYDCSVTLTINIRAKTVSFNVTSFTNPGTGSLKLAFASGESGNNWEPAGIAKYKFYYIGNSKYAFTYVLTNGYEFKICSSVNNFTGYDFGANDNHIGTAYGDITVQWATDNHFKVNCTDGNPKLITLIFDSSIYQLHFKA